MQPVAVGILMKNGHVLACQRKQSARYPLKWEFPGGKIKAKESAWEALVRELHEELNIVAHGGDEFFQQEWVYPEGFADPQRDGAFKVFYFLVRSFTGKPMNLAFEQIRWVRPLELLSLDTLEGNKSAVDLLIKHEAHHRANPGSV